MQFVEKSDYSDRLHREYERGGLARAAATTAPLGLENRRKPRELIQGQHDLPRRRGAGRSRRFRRLGLLERRVRRTGRQEGAEGAEQDGAEGAEQDGANNKELNRCGGCNGDVRGLSE